MKRPPRKRGSDGEDGWEEEVAYAPAMIGTVAAIDDRPIRKLPKKEPIGFKLIPVKPRVKR